MIAHYTPGIYFHPFFLLAISQTIKNDIFIFIPCKYIYPFNNSKAYKIDSYWIMELIISTHCNSCFLIIVYLITYLPHDAIVRQQRETLFPLFIRQRYILFLNVSGLQILIIQEAGIKNPRDVRALARPTLFGILDLLQKIVNIFLQ